MTGSDYEVAEPGSRKSASLPGLKGESARDDTLFSPAVRDVLNPLQAETQGVRRRPHGPVQSSDGQAAPLRNRQVQRIARPRTHASGAQFAGPVKISGDNLHNPRPVRDEPAESGFAQRQIGLRQLPAPGLEAQGARKFGDAPRGNRQRIISQAGQPVLRVYRAGLLYVDGTNTLVSR